MEAATTALSFSEKRHQLARTGLGGSDAAAVLGLDPYRTPLEVWMACTGRVEPDEKSEAAEWGQRLEAEVLRKYAEGLPYPEVLVGRDRKGQMAWYEPQTDGSVEIRTLTNGDPIRAEIGHLFGTLRHPDMPHLMMHLDGLVVDCESLEVLRLVDAKTAGYWAAKKQWGDEGTDETPEKYIVQGHDYAGILAANGHPVPTCDIPALHGGQSYRLYTIDISTTLYRRIHERLDEWWREHVEGDVMPEPSGADNRALGIVYPEDTGESVIAPEGLHDWARALGEYRDAQKEAKEGRSECEAKIKAAIGEASEIVGDDWKVTWKRTADRTSTDYEAVVDDLRTAIEVLGDSDLLETLDAAIEERTETKPGYRRLLTYGLAKTAEVDSE